MVQSPDITTVLRAVRHGEPEAERRLFESVYDEMYRIARGQRFRWQGNETLNATALVHEAYLKLVDQHEADWSDRRHFFAVASKAMRHVLIDYAERQLAAKRGGGAEHLPLDEASPVAEETTEELLDLHRALEALSAVHERPARVVECRFFGGLTTRETAETLQVSVATVERDWVFASAWLRRTLKEPTEGSR